jgi:alpha-N-arabinofuranosidase
MKSRAIWILFPAALCASVSCSRTDEPIRVRVDNRALHHVDDRLFGHFMERASWGEPGYDAARVGQTGKLDPRVTAILDTWAVPVIRWPGGGDLQKIDWRDMVDNVPGRSGSRPLFDVSDKHPPLTNRFGVDEFLQLCEQLQAEAMLPVNFQDALAREKPLDAAALLAAGLVAYCNAPLGAELPESMPDWPAIRAKNGHPEPYNVRYFQIGNEVWIYARKTFEALGMGQGQATTEQRAAWYLKCFNAYADAMRRIDPHIELITEWNPVGTKLDADLHPRIWADPAMDKADWFVRHTYAPWAIRKVFRDGREIEPKSLSDEQIWNAWVCLPGIDPDTGLAELGWARPLRAAGRRVAVTEWNWNGWWALPADRRPEFNSELARGVGAAGWLHAFMRLGDVVGMACQSMTVGSRWGITGIRVDPTGQAAPYPLPTGQVTGLYSRYHGNTLLAVQTRNVPHFAQPLEMAGIEPAEKVLALDIVATGADDAVYLHVINRSFSDDLTAHIELRGFGDLAGPATLHALTGRVRNQPPPGQDRQVAAVTDRTVPLDGTDLEVTFPKRSVCVLVVPRRSSPEAD